MYSANCCGSGTYVYLEDSALTKVLTSLKSSELRVVKGTLPISSKLSVEKGMATLQKNMITFMSFLSIQ